MDELLTLLSQTEYLSGERLCERLGMTRGAVWKRMEKLRAEGYRIEAAGKKGYRLEPVEDSLLPGYIALDTGTRWAGRGDIDYAPQTPSTNTRLREMARAGAPHGRLALCDVQSQGRGRLARRWETPDASSLTQSLRLRPHLPAEQAQLCTLCAAVAMARAVREVCPTIDARIKWPNDVVAGGKKCAGILCELSAGMDGIDYLVMGVGLNVNQRAFPEELRDKATSLCRLQGGKPLCRRHLLCAYLRHMENAVDALEREGLAGILPAYKELSVTLGARVRVAAADGEFTGTARDIDETGALLVVTDAGAPRRVLCGDVSVRGLMGYCE